MQKVDLDNYYDFFEQIFHPIIDDENRFIVLMGGAGSGKSYAAVYKIIYRMLTEPGVTIAIVRKTQRSIRQSCYSLLSSIINELGLNSVFTKSKTDMSFECLNGSRIISIGCDDVEKVKSIVADSFFIEEATELTKNDFEQLNLRLRGTEYYKQIILAFNPISHYHWLKKYFFDRTELDNVTIITSTYKDNPYLDEDYKKELESLALTNKNMHKIYVLGEWGRNEEGAVFTNIKYGKPKTIKRTFYGIDFGFRAPTALVRIDVDDDDNYYLHEELYKTGLTTNEIILEMNNLEISQYEYIYADSAEPDRILEMKQAGYNVIPTKKGTGSVEIGCNIMRNLNLYTHPGNKNLNKELESYSFIEKDSEFLDKIDRVNDHCIDAARYGITSEILHKTHFTPVSLI